MAEPRILPPSAENLAAMAKLQSADRCVLTVYFPGSLARGKKLPARLSKLPAALLSDESLTADEEEHRRLALELWQAAVPKITLPPSPGWLGVVSWMTEGVFFVPLPVAVEPAAYLDNSPFLFPAGRLLDDFETYAVVYADHARAAIYLAALGRLHEEERLRGDIKNHVRKGGWSQQRYERRRNKEIHRYCQTILDKLCDLVEREKLRRIVLTGDQILLHELEERMTPGMHRLVIGRFAIADEKTSREIFHETLTVAAEEEKREELWLRNAIRSECGAGRAVVGPVGTLTALREKRVRRMLIGLLENQWFWRCGGCGDCGLGQGQEEERQPTCRDCGGMTYRQSAVNEFLDLAFAGGSRVEFTDDDLDEFDGVGALLRW